MLTGEDENLIRALRNDDRAAITSIFLKYHHILCRVAQHIVSDSDEAKDVAQEVFIKLWRNRTTLKIDYSLESYLKRAVINTALNRLQQKKRFTPLDMQDAMVVNVRIAESQQDIAELQARIDAAIDNLPPRTKTVFTLIRFEEMSYREVADSLDISLKAVEKEMMKALKLLRLALRDYLIFLVLTALNSTFINFYGM